MVIPHLPSNLQPRVNWQANVAFTIFAFDFPLVCTFLHHILHRVNFCKSNFSCSELSLKWEENYFLFHFVTSFCRVLQ